jgi:hypothetical protein
MIDPKRTQHDLQPRFNKLYAKIGRRRLRRKGVVGAPAASAVPDAKRAAIDRTA